MTHKITHDRYLRVRDEVYTVISFDRATKRRRATYGGLSLIAAVREIQKMQAHGAICILFGGTSGFNAYDTPHKGWHLDDYEQLLNDKGLAAVYNGGG